MCEKIVNALDLLTCLALGGGSMWKKGDLFFRDVIKEVTVQAVSYVIAGGKRG